MEKESIVEKIECAIVNTPALIRIICALVTAFLMIGGVMLVASFENDETLVTLGLIIFGISSIFFIIEMYIWSYAH